MCEDNVKLHLSVRVTNFGLRSSQNERRAKWGL